MHRSIALVGISSLLLVSPALARDVGFIIVQPGYPGSTSEAESFVDDLSTAISGGGGPQGLKGKYYNDGKAALKAIGEEKPEFGIVSLGFYLAHRGDLHLGAILESRPPQPFFLAAKKGEPVTPQDLAGQVVEGTGFQEKELVERILFGPGAGGGPVKAGNLDAPPAKAPAGDSAKPVADVRQWKVQATDGYTKGVRDTARGKARAALLTERERLDMEKLPAGKELEVFYRTEALPLALVVSFGGENEAAKKSAAALESLGKSAEGKELLQTMGIEGFAAVDGKRLKQLEERYGIATSGPATAGEKHAVR